MAENASMWAAVAMIGTTVVTAVIAAIRQARQETRQAQREERQRVWFLEDRENSRKDRHDIAARQEAVTTEAATKIRTKLDDHKTEVLSELKDNTKVSTDAFLEANGTKREIADLQGQSVRLQEQILRLQQQTTRRGGHAD